MRAATTGLLVLSLMAIGCGDDDDENVEIVEYESDIVSKSGSTVEGTVTVTSENGKVTVKVQVEGATPGEHGVHLHQTADCSSDDAMSAGGHWNPEGHMHGAPTGTSHAGDLGNITIAADGTGTLTISKPEWKLEDGSDDDVIGRALVVHANVDDLMTDPTGNAGGRQGCAEID